MNEEIGYKGNTLLKKSGIQQSWTPEQVDEFIKCSNDPIYFINKYLKAIDADKGLIGIKLRDYQEKMVKSFHGRRRTIVTTCRRSGKSTSVCGYILWYIIFNNDKTVALLANKGETARELLGLIQLGYKNLPLWIQQGVLEFNKGSFVLENNSRVIASATSSDAIRGYTISLLYIDECAFIDNWEAFSASVLPTITSGKETKIILVSTPFGLNFYHKLWEEALDGTNGYNPIMVKWYEVPGNDEKWYQETLQTLGNDLVKFAQEYEVEFQGSTNTLIRGDKLKSLVPKQPICTDNDLDIHKEPEPNHTYCITVDVAEGQNLDYSAFSVIDVTQIPYRQVAKYRNNNITPLLFPTVIYQAATKYNDAFVLVEINSIGLQVADILHHELAYDNLIKIEMKGKQGQQHSPGFKKKIAYGLKTTHQTKITGCANLKTLIESDKLIINDAETIMELTTFSADKKTFKAEEGNTDDLAMTLVHFGWLTGQRYFKENINNDIRQSLQLEQMNIMDQDIVPFGIVDNGLDDPFEKSMDADGDVWTSARGLRYPFDQLEWDILSNKHKL
jgi:hypothetical protein